MRVGSLIVSLLLVAAPDIMAQPNPGYGETVEVRIINVDVVVRDDDGNLVPGLTAEDFIVYEGGRAQPITNFAEYREQGSQREQITSIGAVAKPPEKRHLVFFFDQLDLRETENREAFFDGVRAFARSAVRDGDEGAVYFWGTSLENPVPMTRDRNAILAAIDTIAEESRLRISLSDMESSRLAALARSSASDARDMAAHGYDDDSAATMELEAGWAAQQAYDLQRRKVYAINAVIQSIAGLDGRKVMVLATERLSKLPGLEYGYGYGSKKEFNARGMIDSIVDAANASALTIYGFFPKGLENDPMRPNAGSYEIMMNDSEPIESIATRTGGTSAIGGKLAEAALEDAALQLGNYYSLAWRATDTRDDRTRPIRVEVRRAGLEARVRSSIVDKSEKEIASERMISGVLFGMAPSSMRIEVSQGKVRRKGSTTCTVPVEITIPISELTALPGAKGVEGRFRILAIAANPDGDVSEVAEKEQAFHISEKELKKARAGTFAYTMEIVVRDTSDRALVAVIDELDEDVGYAELKLDLGKIETGKPAAKARPPLPRISSPSPIRP